MIRIIKGDIILECDTQADVALAVAALTGIDFPALPEIPFPYIPVANIVDPDGFVDEACGAAVLGETESDDSVQTGHLKIAATIPAAESALRAVPTLESVATIAPQLIPVRRRQLDVLEAVLLFPEGVPGKGISQLLGLSEKTVSGRMQSLRRDSLVEMVPHTHAWRATSLARRAKLVAS